MLGLMLATEPLPQLVVLLEAFAVAFAIAIVVVACISHISSSGSTSSSVVSIAAAADCLWFEKVVVRVY